MYYQIKVNNDEGMIVNELNYEELISELACKTEEHTFENGFYKKRTWQVYDEFLKRQTLSANNISERRCYQIVEADFVDDVVAGKYRIIDVRIFESAVRNCTSAKYVFKLLGNEPFGRFRRSGKCRQSRHHKKNYNYTIPGMLKSYYKVRYMVEEPDEDIPDYVRIKPTTRAKRNVICNVCDKIVVDENNWKSQKVKKQYMVNRSKHRYTLKHNMFDVDDEYDQDELLQEDFDQMIALERMMANYSLTTGIK